MTMLRVLVCAPVRCIGLFVSQIFLVRFTGADFRIVWDEKANASPRRRTKGIF